MKLRWARLGLLLVVLLTLLQACIGGGRPTPGYRNIEPGRLYEMLGKKDFFLLNVHIPYEGQIPGTDALTPYNEIDRYLDKLPSDKEAKIVVYCMSGNMSVTAATRLVELGYIRVSNLEGGMLEWHRQGYPLEDWAR